MEKAKVAMTTHKVQCVEIQKTYLNQSGKKLEHIIDLLTKAKISHKLNKVFWPKTTK